MELFEIAEANYAISYSSVFLVGILQGIILGRGIRNRFPSLKRHARIVSVILLVVFTFSAIVNVIKFTNPEKISLSELTLPQTTAEFFSIVIDILGINAGFGAAVGIFITVSLIVIFRFAKLHPISRYFLFALSVIVVLVAIIGRITDFVPTQFQIFAYAFYQFGITLGLFGISVRKEKEDLPEFK